MLNICRRSGHPLLDHEGMGDIKDNHRRMVTAVLLENQEKTLKEEQEFLGEAAPTNSTGAGISNFDPVLISLIRIRAPCQTWSLMIFAVYNQ